MIGGCKLLATTEVIASKQRNNNFQFFSFFCLPLQLDYDNNRKRTRVIPKSLDPTWNEKVGSSLSSDTSCISLLLPLSCVSEWLAIAIKNLVEVYITYRIWMDGWIDWLCTSLLLLLKLCSLSFPYRIRQCLEIWRSMFRMSEEVVPEGGAVS
jgi:hypothetical protein